jgi:AcrR family transcriptional regulator
MASHNFDLGRRSRKKLATRQALRITALQLVAQRGFANVTIEAITEAADVSLRTFFNYFPTKESAVIGIDPERLERFRVTLLGRPAAESPLTAIRAAILADTEMTEAELNNLDEGRAAWFQRFQIVRNDPDLRGAYAAHIGMLEETFTRAIAERLGVDPTIDPYPALLAATTLAAARSAALFWKESDGSDSLTELTAHALDNLANGLLCDHHPLKNSRDGTSAATTKRRARGETR